MLILPPVDSQGCAVGDSDRITLDLKKPLSEKEEQEVRTMAEQKLPLMDRIWFLVNIFRIKKDLQCLAEVLPKFSSLPPNCEGLDVESELAKTCDELRRLSDNCREDLSDIPEDIRGRLGNLTQHPSRLMLWAHHDANQKVPARLMKQIMQLVAKNA